MSTKQQPGQQTIWDNLSKAEQQAIKKQLDELRKQEPAKQPPKGKGVFQLKGYARCELSSADKEAFKVWEDALPPADLLNAVVTAADDGYLVKLGQGKESFQATLSAADTGKDWEGYVLTSFASSPIRAIALLIYKHQVLMELDWNAFIVEGGEDFMR